VRRYSPEKAETEVLNVADTTLQVDCDFRKVIEFLNDLDEPKKEWQLFLHINKPQHECWKERLEKWCLHFALYQAIDSSPGEPIQSMFTHLTVLDGKFSLALTINSFILTATTFLVTHVSDMTALLNNAPMKAGFQDGLIGLSGVIGIFSLLNMWNCLKGVRRVVWGDLGHWITAERPSNNPTAIVLRGDVDRAKHDHAKFLILAIARRTNRFRIAIYVTKFIMFMVSILFIYTVGEIISSNWLNGAFH
jgi:hypothetical protein